MMKTVVWLQDPLWEKGGVLRSFEALLVADAKAAIILSLYFRPSTIWSALTEYLPCAKSWCKCLGWISHFISTFYLSNNPIPIRKYYEFPLFFFYFLTHMEMVFKFIHSLGEGWDLKLFLICVYCLLWMLMTPSWFQFLNTNLMVESLNFRAVIGLRDLSVPWEN